MFRRTYLQNGLIGAVAILYAGAPFIRGSEKSGPVLTAAIAAVKGPALGSATATPGVVTAKVATAIEALSPVVGTLSSPAALEDAFRGYFTYKSAHPADVKKPLLYFVDYGLPSTQPRGYVFDMDALRIVDGPFTVAHGRGSSGDRNGVPTRFSNATGSAASSLGLFLTKAIYAFTGNTGGRSYRSVGLRLDGVSGGFNDNALARGVVAHGAPYVTPAKAGRSEGCPAMEPARAARLLPKLADGAMVFLYAPNQAWLAGDPWLAAASND